MVFLGGVISIVTLGLSSFLLSRVFKPERPVAGIIFFFLVFTGQIIVLGFILSGINRLSSQFYWALFSVALLVSTLVITSAFRRLRRLVWAKKIAPSRFFSFTRQWFKSLPRSEKVILICLGIAVMLVNTLNLAVVLFTAPHIWDNMTYRLARVAYYLQHGNIDYFDANMCSQVLIQKNSELLQLYLLLVSGNKEQMVQLVQFISYWVIIFTVYGITREIGLKKSAGLFGAGVFALLTQSLLQSTTANNDLLLTAYIGCALYSLFAFSNSRKRKFLFPAGIGIGLGVGVKASILMILPSLLVTALYIFFARDTQAFLPRLKNFVLFLFIFVLALGVFALPAGYLENYRLFGHPMGDEHFRKLNVVEGAELGTILRNGLKHLLAYGVDSLALDGLPPVPLVNKIQSGGRSLFRSIFDKVGINLESDPSDTWYYDKAWYYEKPPISNSDYSFWGIFGFSLIWPALFLLLVGIIKSTPGRMLAIAVILFVVVHAFSGATWGHYSLYSTVFAAPAAGYLLIRGNKILRGYIIIIIGIGCFSGITSVLFRFRSPILVDQSIYFREYFTPSQREVMPLPVRTDSIFLRDRLSQLLRDGPIFEEPIRKFEELVPPEAVVAVCLNPNSYEYPLFGYGLTRTIIPLNSFWRGLQPIPKDAEYLLWADDFDEIFNRNENDIHLGKDWYLRKLK